MSLIEQIRKSEVFADLAKEDRKAIVHALKAGNDEVIDEVTSILDEEKSINELFDKSIDELTTQTVSTIKKRLDTQEKKRKIAKKEAVSRKQDQADAEHDLEILADLSPANTK